MATFVKFFIEFLRTLQFRSKMSNYAKLNPDFRSNTLLRKWKFYFWGMNGIDKVVVN